MSTLDAQAKHDPKWIGIWAATRLIFALIGYLVDRLRSSPAAFLYFYGVASYGA
jgi:hypothetical protein